MQAQWTRFKPTYPFNEGGNPPVFDSVEETVGRNGEAALVRWLARRDGVPVQTLDPSQAQTVAALGVRFTREQFKVSAVLGHVAQQRRRAETFRPANLDSEVSRVLAILTRVPGLEGPPTTIEELDDSGKRLLPTLADWRNVDETWFDPATIPGVAWTNELSRFINDYRDQFMVATIAQKMAEGHRVFAVVGGSHVVMQERLLRWRVARLTSKAD